MIKLNKNLLILPPQLYENTFELKDINKIYLYEHPYYFTKFSYHKQKILLHRSSMKFFQNRLSKQYKVIYIKFNESFLDKLNEDKIYMYQPADSYIKTHFTKQLADNNIKIEYYKTPKFLTEEEYNRNYFQNNKFYHFYYYKKQRKRLNILIDKGKPVGGKWSFDPKNRKKFPKDINIKRRSINRSSYIKKAKKYIEKYFSDNPGSTENFIWPIDHAQALKFFEQFLVGYFSNFGPYQDAFDADIDYGFHSLISSSLNIGIITPQVLIDKILEYYKNEDIKIESIEGFIRQVIGWREYVKAIYDIKEPVIKESNFFELDKNLPDMFYTAETEIRPVDKAIERVIKNAYTHHIERLMVLGNIMLLLSISPDEVYRWFMELFIDSYDWVMTPNIYGMSQFAYPEMMTKPYISSSNYILKMSHYKEKQWAEIWDALYWTFINKNKKKLSNIQRMRLMLSIIKKMDQNKLDKYQENAEHYIKNI